MPQRRLQRELSSKGPTARNDSISGSCEIRFANSRNHNFELNKRSIRARASSALVHSAHFVAVDVVSSTTLHEIKRIHREPREPLPTVVVAASRQPAVEASSKLATSSSEQPRKQASQLHASWADPYLGE